MSESTDETTDEVADAPVDTHPADLSFDPETDDDPSTHVSEEILERLYAGELIPCTILTLVGPGDDLLDLP